MILRSIAAMAAMVIVLTGSAFSQGALLTPGGQQQVKQATGTFGGAYYDFTSQSGCDLLISVWGFVANPGRYNVPCETNLLDLLSYCGGPNKGAFLDRVRIIRRGGVDKQNEIAEVFEVDIQKYLELSESGSEAKDLLLFPRDLIVVDGESLEGVDYVLRVAQVIVAITSVITATVAIINISK